MMVTEWYIDLTMFLLSDVLGRGLVIYCIVVFYTVDVATLPVVTPPYIRQTLPIHSHQNILFIYISPYYAITHYGYYLKFQVCRSY